jgi:hypothetical protein
MCPCTFFVVRFVNLLEAEYPFADNLHPPMALANILWRENPWGLKTVAWMLTRFAIRYPSEMLSSTDTAPDIGVQVRDAIQYDRDVREAITSWRNKPEREGGRCPRREELAAPFNAWALAAQGCQYGQ